MLKRLFPFIGWRFTKGDIRADFLAGLTVTLVLIPQSMAYAQLAGLPVVVGLYASFLPVIFGALWGSSHHLQTGPVAMTSLLTATALMPLAVPETAEYVVLAGVLAVVLGIIRLIIGFFKLTVDHRDRRPHRAYGEGQGNDGRGQYGTRPRKGQLYAEVLPDPTVAAEAREQQIARDHRRDNQWRMNEAFE